MMGQVTAAISRARLITPILEIGRPSAQRTLKCSADTSTAVMALRMARGVERAQDVTDHLLSQDKALRELLVGLQNAQARRNEVSKLIGQAKAKKDEAGAAALMAEVAGLKDTIQQGEAEQRVLENNLRE